MKLLDDFLHFNLLGEGMMIRVNIRRKTIEDKGNGMIMNNTQWKNKLGV
jgi:hypothetical protein